MANTSHSIVPTPLQGSLPLRSLHQCKMTPDKRCCNVASRCTSIEDSANLLREDCAPERVPCSASISALQSAGNSASCLPDVSKVGLSSSQHFHQSQAILGTAAMALLTLRNLNVPQLQWRHEVRYERTSRRWFGLRGGKVIQVVQPAPWYSPEGAWRGAQSLAPIHVWTFIAGMLFSTLLHSASSWYQEQRRAYQAEKVQASQALEASKRSLFAQRSRFERALGALGEDELATTPEEDIADVNEPETSVNADSSREEEIGPRWQYDKDAMREWESFIKQSKSAQVMEDQWWDLDDSVEERQPLPTITPAIDWNK